MPTPAHATSRTTSVARPINGDNGATAQADRRDATMTFGVESAVQGNIGHLVLRGEFDIATAPAVSTAGLKLLDSPGVKTLMIDMAAVTFVGSTGLVPS
jgi:hypothetical protein